MTPGLVLRPSMSTGFAASKAFYPIHETVPLHLGSHRFYPQDGVWYIPIYTGGQRSSSDVEFEQFGGPDKDF